MSCVNLDEVKAAYESVRSDKDETNWVLLSYAEARGDKLALTGTGSGGLEELAEQLDEGQAQYAYARIEYANDSESKRVKFIFVVWIGESTKVMRKAGVSIHAGHVKDVFAHHSIQVTASNKGELKEESIVKRLRAAGGADYNGGRG